jgi:hypothetical protein
MLCLVFAVLVGLRVQELVICVTSKSDSTHRNLDCDKPTLLDTFKFGLDLASIIYLTKTVCIETTELFCCVLLEADGHELFKQVWEVVPVRFMWCEFGPNPTAASQVMATQLFVTCELL